MKPYPRVSVIMPAYNAERFIEQAIRSVLSQTYTDWELIVVDDGSRDRTAEIARDHAVADARIKVVSQPNGRLANARNTGIRHARGELIAFLDSDDLWMAEKLQSQVKVIDLTRAGVVFTDGFLFHEENAQDESRTFDNIAGRFTAGEMLDQLFSGNKIPVLSAIVRREILIAAGGFDESPALYSGCEDYDLWFRLAQRETIFFGMKERLVRYRLHTAGMSAKRIEMLRTEIALLRRYYPLAHHRDRLVEKSARRKITALYRELSATLLAHERLDELREHLNELRVFDRIGFRTLVHLMLVKLLSRRYNKLREHWISMTSAEKRG